MKDKQTKYMLHPGDIEKNALRLGVSPDDMCVSGTTILTFNEAILESLRVSCNLRERRVLNSTLSPYAFPMRSLEGTFEGQSLSVLIPPMGASPIAAFCEELIHFGARRIFLLCASWSLGEKYLRKGQIHLPNIAIGMDGTSPHYGNVDYRVEAEPDTQHALRKALSEIGADWKEGGIGCCEAFYRITRETMNEFRERGCLSMDNGEVAVLYSLSREKDIQVGILLQPYLDLEKGFDTSYLDEIYKETCRMQARAALRVVQES